MTNETKPSPQRSTTTLWILLAISILPFIAATAYYQFGNFTQFSNNGEILKSLIDIQSLQLNNEDGQAIERESLTKKWRMILIVNKNCDKNCQISLYNMRQLNVALGKNYDRFRHMLIHTENMNKNFTSLLENKYKETLHAYTSEAVLNKVFKDTGINIFSNSIYIMDPTGNIMMRFDQNMNPKLILKDLNRLLKVSQIG